MNWFRRSRGHRPAEATTAESAPPRPGRRPPSVADGLTVAVLVAATLLVGTASFLSSTAFGPGDAAVAEQRTAIQTLRRIFGYDGIGHDLDRLRRSADPAALVALEGRVAQARQAIGVLRRSDAAGQAAALDELESASRRLDALLDVQDGTLADRLVQLPLVEPLFVLDRAVDGLDQAMRDTARLQGDRLLTAVLIIAALLAALSMLLAAWLRTTVTMPLRRLATDAGGSAQALAASPVVRRLDEIGAIARALVGRSANAATATLLTEEQARRMDETLADTAQRLETVLDLVRGLDGRLAPPATATVEATPLRVVTAAEAPPAEAPARSMGVPSFLKAGPEPVGEEPPAEAVAAAHLRGQVLQAMVQMMADEHQRRRASQAEFATLGDAAMLDGLVDRVMARLDEAIGREPSGRETSGRRPVRRVS